MIAGELDDVRVIVESLAQEFDVMDVAAAAVKLAHAAVAGDEDERDLPPVVVPSPHGPRRDERLRQDGRPPRGDRRPRSSGANTTRLFIGAGRREGIRPADLVGAIANEAGISSRDLGAIEIADRFSLVEVPEEVADDVVAAMRKATLRGQKVTIRRDRDTTG